MHQLLLPEHFAGELVLTLTGDEFHHLVHVLRGKTGDSIPAISAAGKRYEAVISNVTRTSCVLSLSPLPELTGQCKFRLYQCLPKGKIMDTVIRQAVEAGVSDITPVLSRYTVPEYSDADKGKKTARWQAIADAAVKQSSSLVRVRINPPIAITELNPIFPGSGSCRGLVCHEKKLSDKTLHELLAGPITSVSLVIGPEGGLSPDELEILKEKRYDAVYLGPRILRTDSAALFAIAAIQLLMLEKESWIVP